MFFMNTYTKHVFNFALKMISIAVRDKNSTSIASKKMNEQQVIPLSKITRSYTIQ